MAPVEEASKSHPDLDLPEHRLHRAFSPTVDVSIARFRHDPLQLALGEVARVKSKHPASIFYLVVAADAVHHAPAAIASFAFGFLVIELKDLSVRADESVLLAIVSHRVYLPRRSEFAYEPLLEKAD